MVISSITFQELEDIKTSRHKDETTKRQARVIVRALETMPHKIHIYRENMIQTLLSLADFEISNDLKILATAYDYITFENPDTIFYTNDLALKQIAAIFIDTENLNSVKEEFQKY